MKNYLTSGESKVFLHVKIHRRFLMVELRDVLRFTKL